MPPPISIFAHVALTKKPPNANWKAAMNFGNFGMKYQAIADGKIGATTDRANTSNVGMGPARHHAK
jgi:hypothetical protein